MSGLIADRDLIVVNGAGQRVVVVPKGQPVPAEHASLMHETDAKAVAAPAEDKAKAAPRKRTRKKTEG